MSRTAAVAATMPSARDLFTLVKPRILFLTLITTAGGLVLAPGTPELGLIVMTLIGVGLLVGAANTLNMYLERDVDALMDRTRERPLPAARMHPEIALWFGLAQAAIAVPLLTFAVNALSGLLGVIALVGYVLVYTPLKQRTTYSTLIGAVPGAMPPLLGWTAVTGALDLGGLALFGVLFMWQIPHFHAIATFRVDDYRRAGLKTVPGEHGADATRPAIVGFLLGQIALSLVLTPLGVAGWAYLVGAALLGAGYFGYACVGLRRGMTAQWARRLFVASILYLPALFGILVANGQQ